MVYVGSESYEDGHLYCVRLLLPIVRCEEVEVGESANVLTAENTKASFVAAIKAGADGIESGELFSSAATAG